MFDLKLKIIAIETIALIIVCWLLVGAYKADKQSTSVPSLDSTISKVTVTVYVPLQGLDKQEAYKAGIIAKDVAKNDDKAVLASGKIEDDSGSREVAAVVDVHKGTTTIEQKRPYSEFMKRFEIGVGYGIESGHEANALQGRLTIGRAGRLYLTGQGEIFNVDRPENKHPYNIMTFVTLRF